VRIAWLKPQRAQSLLLFCHGHQVSPPRAQIGTEACTNGRLCIDKPGALLKRVGALQKDIALLKTLAIP
jgi:hypothetical protein